jgi:hypothetical protein
MRHHQRAVDAQHHHARLAHPAGERGLGQPVGQLPPHVRPDGGAHPADRRAGPPTDLGQSAPGGGVRGHRAEHLTLGAQRLHIHDVAGPAGDRRSHVRQHPAPIMDRVETAAGQHLRQPAGQAGAVGQHPYRHRPGPRHDPPTIGGQPQILAPCRNIHLEGAFHEVKPVDSTPPVSLTWQALSRSHAARSPYLIIPGE